jgi:tetratricopeptide (TPR) repeat protein
MADSAAELFLLEAWVADNPGSRLFFKLAQAYKEAGRLEESAQVLQRGLVMHPAMVDARRLLAEVHGQMGDSEAALSQLMTAAAELCRHAGVFDGLASLWGSQGQPGRSQRCPGSGSSLGPGTARPFQGPRACRASQRHARHGRGPTLGTSRTIRSGPWAFKPFRAFGVHGTGGPTKG